MLHVKIKRGNPNQRLSLGWEEIGKSLVPGLCFQFSHADKPWIQVNVVIIIIIKVLQCTLKMIFLTVGPSPHAASIYGSCKIWKLQNILFSI
jgi:hypothetical protein